MYVSYPPKPKDPKAPWDLIWSVKLRLKSTGMAPLTGTQAAGPRRSREKEATEPSSESRKSGEEQEGSKSPINKLKGLFGF